MRRFCVVAALLTLTGCPAALRPVTAGAPGAALASSLPDASRNVQAPLGTTAAPAAPEPVRVTAESVAKEFLEALRLHDFAGAASRFDPTMRRTLPAAALQGAWRAIEERHGGLEGAELIEVIPRPPRTHAWYRCAFEREAWNAEVVINGAREVSGLRLAPAPPAWSAPAYADETSFAEQPASFGEPPLAGILSVPRQAASVAVVLVHGSGPQDADASTGPAGTGTKIFKDLAWGLASRGIAVLRYPKRTWAWPDQFEGKAFTLDDEVTSDACEAVQNAAARMAMKPSRVVVVAHSLGAAMAPRIARACPELGGLVLLAGPSRTLDDVLFEQFEYLHGLAGKDRGEVAGALSELLAGFSLALGAVGAPDDELAFSGMRGPRSYWVDVSHYDPVREVAQAPRVPMLLMQGGRDYQVRLVDFEGWKHALRGRRNVAFRLYPSLDHRFVAGQGPATPADYDRMQHVDGLVIDDVARWLTGLASAAQR